MTIPMTPDVPRREPTTEEITRLAELLDVRPSRAAHIWRTEYSERALLSDAPPDGAAEREADRALTSIVGQRLAFAIPAGWAMAASKAAGRLGYRLDTVIHCNRVDASVTEAWAAAIKAALDTARTYDPPKPTPAPIEASAVESLRAERDEARMQRDGYRRRIIAETGRDPAMAPFPDIPLPAPTEAPAAASASAFRPAAVTDAMVRAGTVVWDAAIKRQNYTGLVRDILTAALAARGPA